MNIERAAGIRISPGAAPNSGPRVQIVKSGRPGRAENRALPYSPDNTFALASLGHVYAVSGNEKKARETIEYLNVLAAQKYVSPYGMAEIYTALDEKEQALAELEKAAAERSWWLIFAGVNPRFDKLRPARRFLNNLKKINLDKFPGGGY